MGRIRIAALAATIVVGMGAAPAGATVPDLERTPATELAAMLAAGELTSVELTTAFESVTLSATNP